LPDWANTILIAIATTVATTLVLALTVQPRLEARNRRIQAAHGEREQFGDAVLNILIRCARLQAAVIPDEASEAVAAGITAERQRWIDGLNEATRILIDSNAPLGYLEPVRGLLVSYAANARGVWLSERPEEKRITLLAELSGAVQNIAFAAWWRRPRRLKSVMELRQLMADLEENCR
jgi:hypothetical protein